MTKQLTVIIGAGASAGATTGTSPHGWSSPVTKDIFDHSHFYDILKKYELVKQISAGITQECKNGASLEEYLKNSLGTQAQYATLKPHRRRQLHELPAYLQNLFSFVSDTFGSATLFGRLIDAIFDKDINVTFVSLNYDLLLDHAIENSAGIKFNHFAFYFSQQSQWVLLKPHGSINWFRQITDYKQTGNTFNSWLSIIHNMDLSKDVDSNIVLIELDKFKDGYYNNTPFYPALAIPNTDYKPLYPVDDFRSLLEKRLSDSENFLLLGFSAFDLDLLQTLHKNVKSVKNLLIVGHKHVDEVYGRLIKTAPIFTRDKPTNSLYGNGFEGLVSIGSNNPGGSDLNNFLNSL